MIELFAETVELRCCAVRLNRTVRYEWLPRENLEEVRLFATHWMHDYNRHGPSMALGGFPPKQRLAMAA